MDNGILTALNSYSDSSSMIHLEVNPYIEQSENGPMYTALAYTALNELSYEYATVIASRLVTGLSLRFDERAASKMKPTVKTVVVDGRVHMSRDNMIGDICSAMLLEKIMPLLDPIRKKEAKHVIGLVKQIPIFSRERPHPRDVILYGYFKYPQWFGCLMFIPIMAMMVSCATKYKRRGESVFVRTDGKLLTYMTCKAFNMKRTWWICNWLIMRTMLFKFGILSVATVYFKWERGHPVLVILNRLNAKGEL